MKVLKFGGTSVGTVESLCNVKKIIERESAEPLIVVVSALGGITDRLIATARMAAAGDAGYTDSLGYILQRHDAVIEGLVPVERRERLRSIVNPLFDELTNIYKGLSLLHDLSLRTLDIVVSYGERISSAIIAHIIDGARHFDARSFIRTNTKWNKHTFDSAASAPLIHAALDEVVATPGAIAIVPGFISTDVSTRDITNLGRGGSDYTAAILAAELGARVLEIWTDVDGFMTADPRVINTAYVINRLSFIEAMELCNFGAKVIYPPTIYPVFHSNIPIYIKNTFRPDLPGTLISAEKIEHEDGEKPIKGISSISDTSLVTISGLGMVGIVGVNARIFNALADNGVSVFMVSQASSENNTSFAVRSADASRAIEVLRNEFASELKSGTISDIGLQEDLATVAIVGENMRNHPGIAGKLFNTLGRNGINLIACAQGSLETNISFVIDSHNLRKALNVIHDSFFLSETQKLNLFIVGIGNVGNRLISQICSQQERLLKEKALEIKVVGIANSHHAIFDREGIDLNTYRNRLRNEGIPADPQKVLEHVIGMNIYNPVFVDCTASAEVAGLYQELLEHNVNIVAANKIAASDNYEDYHRLKEIAKQRDVKFLFETNVGAGLPIISTLNNLINSGDKILRIEAVLSGTLNYIFNVLSEEIKLSDAITRAMNEGYSEPDPRIDLSGKDVVRKLVILAREAGYRLEQDDVEKNLFIPDEFFEGSVEDFFKAVKTLDDDFETRRSEAQATNRHFRFVARFDTSSASVSLESVSTDHPFYNLEGSNNVISLTTSRYHEHPIIIKGYGAGAEVTAAGVFADIISIANIR